MTEHRLVTQRFADKVLLDALAQEGKKLKTTVGEVKLTTELKARLEAICVELGQSRHSAIGEAIERWVKWQENRRKV